MWKTLGLMSFHNTAILYGEKYFIFYLKLLYLINIKYSEQWITPQIRYQLIGERTKPKTIGNTRYRQLMGFFSVTRRDGDILY